MENNNPNRREVLATIATAGAATTVPPFPARAATGGTEIATAAAQNVQDRDGLNRFLMPGIYEASEFTTRSSSLRLVAAIPGTVTIKIPPGQYLFQSSQKIGAIHLEGIRFEGGAGTLNLLNTEDNVVAPATIHRCEFIGYTTCAIGNNSNNYPWLRVSECRFIPEKGASAIGIAWGGYIDCSIIEANLFGGNRYHLKLGPRLSGTVMIRNNDFNMPSRFERRADIWFVPNDDKGPRGRNSGYGSAIEANKFGNELQAPGAPRILVAAEESGPTDRALRYHADSWRDDAFLNGLSIIGNRISGIADPAAPFLRSHIAGLQYLTWDNNKLDGGRYRYAVEFVSDRPPSLEALHWSLRLSEADGPSKPRFGFANLPNAAHAMNWPGKV